MQRKISDVTVVIPFYNASVYLAAAIDSALNQTYPVEEIILVDDGSYDESHQIAIEYSEQYTHVKILKTRRAGVSGARNKGLKESRTEYVAFLDGDDVWGADKIRKQMRLMTREDADVCVAGYKEMYRWGAGRECLNVIRSGDEVFDFVEGSVSGWVVTWLVKKKFLFENAVFFNEEKKSGEDAELFFKMILLGKVVGLPTVEAYYRIRKKSLTSHGVVSVEKYTHLYCVWCELVAWVENNKEILEVDSRDLIVTVYEYRIKALAREIRFLGGELPNTCGRVLCDAPRESYGLDALAGKEKLKCIAIVYVPSVIRRFFALLLSVRQGLRRARMFN